MKTPRRDSRVSRRVSSKSKEEALPPEEVARLEEEAKRFAASERAWQSMTAPLAEDDPYTGVEEHLLQERGDPDRRWKFFSK